MSTPNPVLNAIKEREVGDKISEMLNSHGYAFIGVNNVDEEDPQPAYVYTVGLCQIGIPDIFVSGNLPQETAMRLINHVIDFWERKKEVKLGRINNFLLAADKKTKFPIGLKEANVNAAIESHMDELQKRFPDFPGRRVVQLLWSDTKGFLPINEGYTEDPAEQQRLLEFI